MTSDHAGWLAQAVDLANKKRYDDARAMAMRVFREDSSNTKALWIIANVTDSIPERRNALKALLRILPDHLAAQHMLNAIDRQYTALKGTTGELRPIKPLGGTPTSSPAERGTGPLLDRLKGILGK